MAEDSLRYDRMVQDALRDVVRQALAEVAESGFPGAHHFYITFRTHHPGVDIPEHLRASYPEEMTIVLQHQFYGLEVAAAHFEVTLSFRKRLERLHIPFAAVVAFVDPAVNFGLQFQPPDAAESGAGGAEAPARLPAESRPEPQAEPQEERQEQGPPAGPEGAGEAGAEKVVSLDAFRKK